MIRTTAARLVGASTLCAVAGLAAPAWAADPDLASITATPPAEPVVQETYPSSRLEDVIVTARRRDERAQDVPIALSVVTNEILERTNTTSVAQLTTLAPSVQLLSSNPRNTAITIRGLGASYGLANDGLEQGVGVYVDQVYYARPATATLDFIDLDRIEVLRGPQGTLFGKNTTAGALNITTQAPTDTVTAKGEVTVGDYGFFQAKATVSGPLTDDLSGRLSVVRSQRDGFLHNVTTDQDQNALDGFGVRAQLQFTPNDQLKIRLYGDWATQDPECCTQLYVRYGATLKPSTQQFPALAAGRGYVPTSLDPYDRLADVDGDIQAKQIHQGLSAIVSYDLGWAGFTSVTAWRSWDWEPANDRDYTSLDITRQSANPSHQSQWSQEFRLASQYDGPVNWVGGLYYFRQDVTTHGVTEYGHDASYWLLGCAPNGLGGCTSAATLPDSLLDGYTAFNDSTIKTDSYAAFAQLTWDITDRLHLTPGLRYTYEQKDGYYRLTTSGGGTPANANENTRKLSIARPQFYTGDISDDSLSGQIALSYELTDTVNVYGTYAQGFKSGGINMAGIPLDAAGNPALNAVEVRPEQVTTYEVGIKSTLFDHRMTANLAAYRTDIEDFQANVVDAGPGALRGYLANVEKVQIQGVEVDFSARPAPWIDVYANGSWTDGEYASFKNGPCPLERVGTSTGQCDLSGKELPGVSPYAASAGFELHSDFSPMGRPGEAFVGADANYRSRYNSDATVSDYTFIDGYTVLNLRAGFRAESGWEASVYVKNALDKDYLSFVSIQSGNSGLIIGNPGDPRTVGITLRARY